MKTSEHTLSGYQLTWLVVGCGAIGGMNLAKLGPAMSQLISDYELSLTVVGLLASIFTLISVFIGVFIGSSMQNLGPKRLILTAMVCAGAGSLIAVLGDSVLILMSARAGSGRFAWRPPTAGSPTSSARWPTSAPPTAAVASAGLNGTSTSTRCRAPALRPRCLPCAAVHAGVYAPEPRLPP